MDPAAPGYAFATGSLGLGIHGRRSRDLGPGFDPHAQLPSIDPDLDLMHLAKLVRDPPFASNLATVIILCGGLRAGGIDEDCDLGSTNPQLGQGSADAVQRHARLPSHPHLQVCMEVLYLRSQGVANRDIPRLCGIPKASFHR